MGMENGMSSLAADLLWRAQKIVLLITLEEILFVITIQGQVTSVGLGLHFWEQVNYPGIIIVFWLK